MPEPRHRNRDYSERPASPADAKPGPRLSRQLGTHSDRVCEQLERLDDVIFSAIGGSEADLAEAHTLWPKVVEELGWDHVAESREQYLRYANDITERFEQQVDYCSENGWRSPEHAITALEIIGLLTKS